MTDPTADAAKLLPCPFCGASAYADWHETDNRRWHSVKCTDSTCAGSMTNGYPDERAAIFYWNTRPPAPQEDGWQLIETLPENILALLYAEYERRLCIGSFRWKEIVEDELISDHPNAKGGRRKVFQEKVTREREWDAENWGATHWRPLPSPPAGKEGEH